MQLQQAWTKCTAMNTSPPWHAFMCLLTLSIASSFLNFTQSLMRLQHFEVTLNIKHYVQKKKH